MHPILVDRLTHIGTYSPDGFLNDVAVLISLWSGLGGSKQSARQPRACKHRPSILFVFRFASVSFAYKSVVRQD